MMAERMDAEGFPYPLHLVVTEACDGDDGRTKSTAGIATRLSMGLDDTIRVYVPMLADRRRCRNLHWLCKWLSRQLG